jgi:hypothetical protein
LHAYQSGGNRAVSRQGYGYNFLPETGIERNLGLQQKLHNRIQEIHDTIGEDSAILDGTEQLNEEAMYAIYEKKGKNLSLFEDDEEENLLDLNEAEEILRQLRKDRPEEYERIANMRDGIRSGMATASRKGLYVFCQADRYQQLFLLDENGEVVSRDIPKVLGAIKCSPETPTQSLPNDYNAAVMRVKRQFTEEVKHREAEREHTVSLTHGQRYVLRELRILFGRTEDEDLKAQINVLEKAFRAANLTSAVKKELNLIRRNNIVGENLMKALVRIYQQHNIRDWVDQQRIEQEKAVPRIICSEALV